MKPCFRSSTEFFRQWNQHWCFVVVNGEPGHLAAAGAPRGRNSDPTVPSAGWWQLQHPGPARNASWRHRVQRIQWSNFVLTLSLLHCWLTVLLFLLNPLAVHLCNIIFARGQRGTGECLQFWWWGSASFGGASPLAGSWTSSSAVRTLLPQPHPHLPPPPPLCQPALDPRGGGRVWTQCAKLSPGAVFIHPATPTRVPRKQSLGSGQKGHSEIIWNDRRESGACSLAARLDWTVWKWCSDLVAKRKCRRKVWISCCQWTYLLGPSTWVSCVFMLPCQPVCVWYIVSLSLWGNDSMTESITVATSIDQVCDNQ